MEVWEKRNKAERAEEGWMKPATPPSLHHLFSGKLGWEPLDLAPQDWGMVF